MKFQIRPLRLRADPSDDFWAFMGIVLACIVVLGGLFLAGAIAG
jgi:hypothetical protein